MTKKKIAFVVVLCTILGALAGGFITKLYDRQNSKKTNSRTGEVKEESGPKERTDSKSTSANSTESNIPKIPESKYSVIQTDRGEQLYSNKTYGFSLTLPIGWKAESFANFPAQISFSSTDLNDKLELDAESFTPKYQVMLRITDKNGSGYPYLKQELLDKISKLTTGAALVVEDKNASGIIIKQAFVKEGRIQLDDKTTAEVFSMDPISGCESEYCAYRAVFINKEAFNYFFIFSENPYGRGHISYELLKPYLQSFKFLD